MAEVDVSCTMATMNEALVAVDIYETPWVPSMIFDETEPPGDPVCQWKQYIQLEVPWTHAILGGHLSQEASSAATELFSDEFFTLPEVPNAVITLLIENPGHDAPELVRVVRHLYHAHIVQVVRAWEGSIARPLPKGTRWSVWVAAQ